MNSTRKIISIVFSIIMTISFAYSVTAEYSNDYEWEYEVISETNIILEYYEGYDSNIKIPSTIDGYNVREIDATILDNVFDYEDVSTITIPSSVTYIADDAFLGFENVIFYVNQGSYAHEYVKNFGLVYFFSNGNMNINTVKINALKSSYTYTGSEIQPNINLKWNNYTLKKDKDYSLSYYNNKNKGKATIKITGKGKFTGIIKKYFSITEKRIKSFKVYDVQYTGKKIYPKLYDSKTNKKYKKDKDYKIKVYGGKSIGKHKIKVTFKGNYKGIIVKYFKVLPKGVKKAKITNVTTTSIHVSWSKVKGVTGYKIYILDSKKIKFKYYKTTSATSLTLNRLRSTDDEIDFFIYAYKKIKGKNYESLKGYFNWKYLNLSAPNYSLINSDFGEITLKFKKYASYQIQWSKSSNFSSIRSGKLTTNSARIYYLSSGQKYYVRARQYRYENGKLKVGPWKVKSIKTY